MEFAQIVEKSGLAPKGMSREGIVIAMQLGYEVGLSPMQAIQNIASINGRPAIWGDAQLALVRASGLMESYDQEMIGEPGTDGRGYRVTVKRRGEKPAFAEFTVHQAKVAGLWGKQGPWTQYPDRMCLFRARGFVLRDQFGDVLKGLVSIEEALDTPREINVTGTGADYPAAGKPSPAATFAESLAGPTPAAEPVPDPAAAPEPEKPAPKPRAKAAPPADDDPTPADVIEALQASPGAVRDWLRSFDAGNLAVQEVAELSPGQRRKIIADPGPYRSALQGWLASQK